MLLRTGDYIPRAGGTIWCMQSFVEQHPDTVKKIIRAIARAVMYFRTNKEGSIEVMRHHIGSIKTDDEAGPSGISCTIPSAPKCRRICSRKSWNRAA